MITMCGPQRNSRMMDLNPYQAPLQDPPQRRRSGSLTIILLVAMVATGILSYLNATQEPNLPGSSTAVLVVVPLFVQLLGVALSILRSYFPNRYTNTFVVPALLIALGCVVVHLAWVIAGEFQEIKSLAQFSRNLFQIHPIAIPFSLIVISVFLYAATAMVVGAAFALRRVFSFVAMRPGPSA